MWVIRRGSQGGGNHWSILPVIGGAEWSDLLGWGDYFAMVLDIDVARVGSSLESVLSGE